MCFNAAKSWYTGWYSAGHEEVTSSLGWEGQLVGIDDFHGGRFDYNAGDRVLLKIPHPGNNTDEDLYVMYNRAKGINRGVVEAKNQVVIVKSPALELVYAVSWRVAELDASDETIFISAEHGYDGGRLVIEVTDISQNPTGTKDYASVSVYFDTSPTAAPTSCTAGDFEIELTTDNFPQETSWEVRESLTGELVASESEYTRIGSNFSHSRCFERNGPFVFTIYDEYGDGMCCNNGQGSYVITFNDVVVHTGSGRFGRSESITLSSEDDGSGLTGLSPPPTPLPTTAPSMTPSTTPPVVEESPGRRRWRCRGPRPPPRCFLRQP
jgi:hypothetical protein